VGPWAVRPFPCPFPGLLALLLFAGLTAQANVNKASKPGGGFVACWSVAVRTQGRGRVSGHGQRIGDGPAEQLGQVGTGARQESIQTAWPYLASLRRMVGNVYSPGN